MPGARPPSGPRRAEPGGRLSTSRRSERAPFADPQHGRSTG
jgi:hypothetical protein